MRATIRELDKNTAYTLEGVFATLSTLNLIEYGGRRELSEVTKNVRRILEMFDVEVLKELAYYGCMFDPLPLLPLDNQTDVNEAAE